MKKNKNILKQILLSVILSLGIIITVFILKNLYPFGNNSIMTGDLYQQNIPFLYNFHDVINGDADLFFTPAISGGSNNFYESIVEIINPVNYLLLLFNRSNIYLAVNIIFIVYIVIASATFTFMLNKLFPKNQKWNVILSLIYAFSGYSLYMYQVIRWLYIFAIFPLFILTIKRLIEDNKGILFSAFLAYFFALSLQFGIMTLLFVLFGSVLYLYLKVEKSLRKQKIFYLGIYTAIGLAISAVIFVPNILNIISSARSQYASAFINVINTFMLGDLFDRIFILFNPLILIVLIIYIIKTIKENKKINNFWGLMSLLMIFTSLFSPINKMWHMGSYMCFPLRYGYMSLLVLICFCKDYLNNIKDGLKIKRNYLKILYYIFFVFILGCLLFFSYINKESISLAFSSLNISLSSRSETIKVLIIMSLALITGIMAFANEKRRQLFLIVAICYSLSISMICLISTSELKPYNIMTNLSKYELGKEEYVRTKENDVYHLNGAFVSNTNSLSGYLPAGNIKNQNIIKAFGYSAPWVSTRSYGGTLFSDLLLRTGYYVNLDNSISLPNFYNKLIEDTDYIVYETKNIFPFGMILNEASNHLDITSNGSPIENQNEISKVICDDSKGIFTIIKDFDYVNSLLNENNQLVPINESLNSGIKFNIIVTKPSIIYLDAGNTLDSYNIYVNGNKININNTNNNTDPDKIIEIGYYPKGKVTIEVISSDYINKPISTNSITVGVMDTQKLLNTQKFYFNQGNLISIYKNNLTANITSKENNKTLFIPIVNIEGWEAYINGNKVEINNLFGGFIGLKLLPGENNIKLIYLPSGLRLGVFISCIGIISLIAFELLRQRIINIKFIKSLIYYIYLITIVVAIIIIYFVPFIGYFIKLLKQIY